MHGKDAILALMQPDEVPDALRFVAVLERGGRMGLEEADEWRRRILARQAFLELRDDAAIH